MSHGHSHGEGVPCQHGHGGSAPINRDDDNHHGHAHSHGSSSGGGGAHAHGEQPMSGTGGYSRPIDSQLVSAQPATGASASRPPNVFDPSKPYVRPVEPIEYAIIGQFREFLNYAQKETSLFAGLDSDGRSVLHWAALYGEIDVVKEIIAHGIPVDVVTPNGQTPLMWAASRGQVRAMAALLQRGANINHRDAVGIDSMLIASQYGQSLSMRFLADKGVSIRTTDLNGCTPAHWAAYNGKIPALRTILELGGQLSLVAVDNTGMNPLHRAVSAGQEEAAEWLKNEGCDPTDKGRCDSSPIDLARHLKNHGLVSILQQPKAKNKKGVADISLARKRAWIYPTALVCVFLVVALLYLSYLSSSPAGVSVHICFVTCLASSITLFCLLWKSDPGYMKRSPGVAPLSDLLLKEAQDDSEAPQTQGANGVCFTCEVIMPERAVHCDMCKRCVARHDHHNPVIATCVGHKNQVTYAGLIASGFFMFVFLAWLCIQIIAVEVKSSGARSFGKVLTELITVHFFGVALVSASTAAALVLMLQLRNILEGAAVNETLFESQNAYSNRTFLAMDVNEEGVPVVKIRNPYNRGFKDNMLEYIGIIPAPWDK
eukprot:Opistho-2@59876